MFAQSKNEITELLPNPKLSNNARGWALRDAKVLEPDAGHSERIVQLHGVRSAQDEWSHIAVSIAGLPTHRKLTFSCYIKGSTSNQKVTIKASTYDAQQSLLSLSSTTIDAVESDWQQFKESYVLPDGTTLLGLWIINTEEHPVDISRPSLKSGTFEEVDSSLLSGAQYGDEAVPKILNAHYRAAVKPLKTGAVGTVTFPIPGVYREQIPLTFECSSEPASALTDYHIYRRKDGLNWLCEATVSPPDRGAIVRWDALVLVNGRKKQELPKVNPSAPSTTVQWLRSTACVQSSDVQIRSKSDELAKDIGDVESFVRKVIAFTSTNQGTGAKCTSLDAKSALTSAPSCTSNANLAAALLRAHGIPARTLSHLPVWSPRLFEHWLVEYWHPEAGWTWAEPTLQLLQPPPNSLVVLAVATADDEDRCFDALHLRYIMQGAAYLSGCLLSKEFVISDILENVDGPNEVAVEGRLHGTKAELDKLLDASLRNFAKITKQTKSSANLLCSNQALIKAIKEGQTAAVVKMLDCMK